jgi:hypothetical protein
LEQNLVLEEWKQMLFTYLHTYQSFGWDLINPFVRYEMWDFSSDTNPFARCENVKFFQRHKPICKVWNMKFSIVGIMLWSFPGKFCKPIVGYDVMKFSRDIVNPLCNGYKVIKFCGGHNLHCGVGIFERTIVVDTQLLFMLISWFNLQKQPTVPN